MAAGRPPGPDLNKLYLILDELKNHPNGLWIRELARRTGLTKSTVSLYLRKYAPLDIEVVHDSTLFKIVKLKQPVQSEDLWYVH